MVISSNKFRSLFIPVKTYSYKTIFKIALLTAITDIKLSFKKFFFKYVFLSIQMKIKSQSDHGLMKKRLTKEDSDKGLTGNGETFNPFRIHDIISSQYSLEATNLAVVPRPGGANNRIHGTVTIPHSDYHIILWYQLVKNKQVDVYLQLLT